MTLNKMFLIAALSASVFTTSCRDTNGTGLGANIESMSREEKLHAVVDGMEVVFGMGMEALEIGLEGVPNSGPLVLAMKEMFKQLKPSETVIRNLLVGVADLEIDLVLDVIDLNIASAHQLIALKDEKPSKERSRKFKEISVKCQKRTEELMANASDDVKKLFQAFTK